MKRQVRGTAAGTTPAGAIDTTSQVADAAEPGYVSATDTLGGAELLEDRTVRIAGGGHDRRAGLSIPGAVAGTFLVAAIAFAAMGPLSSGPTSSFDTNDLGAGTAAEEPAGGDGSTDGDKPDGDGTDGTDGTDGKTDATDGTEPDGDTDGDKPDGGDADATPKPETPDEEKPDPTTNPAPEPKAIEIGLALEAAAVVVEWSACETEDFAYYKVIRSKDEHATWPLGAGDSLAAAIEDQAVTRFVDKAVEGGRTYHYKVVALMVWEGTKVVACRSDAAAITTPAPPKPEPSDDGGDGTMSIALAIKEGGVLIDWSACPTHDFDYYKVVRSSDSTVTWPPSDNDSKVAAVGKDGETKAWDGSAPGGKKVYYRVFCIRETESGSVAVAATAVKGIETPPAEPAPDPVVLGFELDVTGEGVVLNWESCTSDKFVYYKVVKSTTTMNPSYLPWTEGTELIGVIEDPGNSQLVDDQVASGQTIYYRVQAIGYWNGQKVVLGQTAIMSVTIP